MRRFSLMIFALAVLFSVGSDRRNPADRRNADQPNSTNAEGLEPVETHAPTAGEPSNAPSSQSIATEVSDAGDAILKTTAIIEAPSRAAGQAAKSDYVTSAPAHVSASVKTGGIDPALEELAGSDLNSAVQSELKRLGCYQAKIDGKWGPKSQAAVKAFGERVGGKWTETPRRELAAALRNYPAAFCTTECAAKTAGGQCAVAVAPGGSESNGAGKDTSYLPPWMQGAKLTNAEPLDATAPDSQKTLSGAAPPSMKPKKSKSGRRRGWEGDRAERSRVTSRQWLPQGWPGTSR